LASGEDDNYKGQSRSEIGRSLEASLIVLMLSGPGHLVFSFSGCNLSCLTVATKLTRSPALIFLKNVLMFLKYLSYWSRGIDSTGVIKLLSQTLKRFRGPYRILVSMKRFTVPLLCTLLTFCVGMIGSRFFGCNSGPVNENWKTYVNEEYGYRLRYPEKWKIWDRESLSLCSPRIKFPCGPTPHEVYATVVVSVRDPEGLELSEYLRSPARGYKDLREVRIAGVKGLATGPVYGDFGRFIDEQVHVLRGGKLYSITAYAVDSCPADFERILTTFEFTR
jgi:hypothetical protein